MAVHLIPLATFSFVGTITPGPNNLMLTSSGLNYGFRRTIPHFLGVYLGFLFMLGVVCLGLGQIFVTYPEIQLVLKYAGSAYLLYLAYRIARAGMVEKSQTARPFTFFEAALFQYLNPKAWMMSVTMASAFISNSTNILWDTMLVVGLHGAISLPAILCWVLFGTVIGRFLTKPKARQAFNLIMAALLVLTTWFIFAD